jgi:hypothetical protein
MRARFVRVRVRAWGLGIENEDAVGGARRGAASASWNLEDGRFCVVDRALMWCAIR